MYTTECLRFRSELGQNVQESFVFERHFRFHLSEITTYQMLISIHTDRFYLRCSNSWRQKPAAKTQVRIEYLVFVQNSSSLRPSQESCGESIFPSYGIISIEDFANSVRKMRNLLLKSCMNTADHALLALI